MRKRKPILYGSFWSDHWFAIIGLLISSILVSPAVNYPDSRPQDRYYIGVGIIIFFAVVFSWVIAGYRRRDQPTEFEIQQEQLNGMQRELEGLHKDVDEATDRIVAQEPRRLTPDQIAVIKEVASSGDFRNRTITIHSTEGIWDAQGLATDFGIAFVNAGWNPVLHESTKDMIDRDLILCISKEDNDLGVFPAGFLKLQCALANQGLIVDPLYFGIRPSAKSGEIRVFIGSSSGRKIVAGNQFKVITVTDSNGQMIETIQKLPAV